MDGCGGDVVRMTVRVVVEGVVNGLRVRVLVAVARVRLIVVVSVSHLEVALRGSHALSVLAQRQLETHRLQQTQVLSLLRCMHSSSVENIWTIWTALEAYIRSELGTCAGLKGTHVTYRTAQHWY